MRIEKKIVETYVNIYIANDGKKFETQDECERYERALARIALKKSDNVTLAIDALDMRPYGRGDNYCNFYTYYWYFIKNEQGLKEFVAMIDSSVYDDEEQHKWIGQWICIERDNQSGDILYIYTLEKTEKEHQKLLNILNITLQKEGTTI